MDKTFNLFKRAYDYYDEWQQNSSWSGASQPQPGVSEAVAKAYSTPRSKPRYNEQSLTRYAQQLRGLTDARLARLIYSTQGTDPQLAPLLNKERQRRYAARRHAEELASRPAPVADDFNMFNAQMFSMGLPDGMAPIAIAAERRQHEVDNSTAGLDARERAQLEEAQSAKLEADRMSRGLETPRGITWQDAWAKMRENSLLPNLVSGDTWNWHNARQAFGNLAEGVGNGATNVGYDLLSGLNYVAPNWMLRQAVGIDDPVAARSIMSESLNEARKDQFKRNHEDANGIRGGEPDKITPEAPSEFTPVNIANYIAQHPVGTIDAATQLAANAAEWGATSKAINAVAKKVPFLNALSRARTLRKLTGGAKAARVAGTASKAVSDAAFWLPFVEAASGGAMLSPHSGDTVETKTRKQGLRSILPALVWLDPVNGLKSMARTYNPVYKYRMYRAGTRNVAVPVMQAAASSTGEGVPEFAADMAFNATHNGDKSSPITRAVAGDAIRGVVGALYGHNSDPVTKYKLISGWQHISPGVLASIRELGGLMPRRGLSRYLTQYPLEDPLASGVSRVLFGKEVPAVGAIYDGFGDALWQNQSFNRDMNNYNYTQIGNDVQNASKQVRQTGDLPLAFNSMSKPTQSALTQVGDAIEKRVPGFKSQVIPAVVDFTQQYHNTKGQQ